MFGGYSIQQLSDAFGRLLEGSGVLFSQERLELGEGLLDWVQVRAIGGQEEQLRARRPDCLSDSAALVAAEVVHHDDIAVAQGWYKKLDHPGEKAGRVDRAVKHARRDHSVTPQTRDKSQRLPMPVRNFGDQALPHGATAMQAGHVCLGPGLIDKNQPGTIDFALMLFPQMTPTRDTRPILLTGA